MGRATAILILAALLAGLSGIFIKWMTTMTPTSIAGLRMFIPLIVMYTYLKWRGTKIFRQNTPKMLLASLINAGRLYFYFIAFIYTSIGAAVTLFYCFPIFVALMGHLFLKERMSSRQWFFLCLAVVGIAITYSHQTFSLSNTDFLGMSAAIISGFGYALTVILFKTESERYDSNEMVFFQNLVGGIIYPFFFLSALPHIAIQDIGIGVIYTLIIGLLVFKLFFIGLKKLDASIASSIMYLEVISAIFFSYFILDERLTTNMVIGGLVVIFSSFMINWERRRQKG